MTNRRLQRFLQTLSPNAYRTLSEDMSIKGAFLQFTFNFFVAFLCLVVIIVPLLIVFAYDAPDALTHFDRLDLRADVGASERVQFAPSVVVELNGTTSADNDDLYITNETIAWRASFIPFLHGELPWSRVRDVQHYSESMIMTILFFLLPSIVFWLGAALFLKYLLIVLVVAGLGALVPRAFGRSVSFGTSLKIALFSANILTFIEMLLMLVHDIGFVPLLLFLIYFVIGIAIVSEKAAPAGEEKPRKKLRFDEF